MIPALLRSPRPNAILAAGVRIKDLCYSVLYCVLFLVFVTPLVLIVQAVLFRANLQSALVWALLIIALSIVIDLRKGTAGARLRTALREDNALFRGPPGLSPQSRPNAAGPAPGPPIVPGKRVHAFNIWVWLVGIGLLLMVGYFSQNKSVPKRYLSKESASAWTVSESDCVTNNGSKTIVTARENSDTWFDPSFYYAFFSDSCSTGDGDADSNIKPQRRKLAQRQNAQSSGTFYADLRSQRCAKRHTKIAKWTRNEISSDCRNTRRCDRCFSV